MSSDIKTLADAQPGGRVRLAGQAISTTELRRNAHVLVLQKLRARFTDAGSPSRTAALDAAIAALSAQPSPGGQGDADEDAYVIDRLAGLLAEIAVIVNGPEPAGTRWSYHDLPEKVAALAARQPVEVSEGGFRAAASRHTASAASNATAEAAIAIARQLNKQPDSVALGEATEFCIEKGGRQSVGEPIAFVSSDMLVSLLKVRSHNWMPEVWALPNGTDSVPLYAALPAQQPAQVYLDGLDRALGEAIDQRDRYHEVADDLAGHIAAITGVDIGEHSIANCPWQNAIEAAEEYKPAQAVDLGKVPHGIRLVEIPRRNGLDPINVFVQDYELGRGRIVVTCYGQAWCGFWGAMGDRTVMQFVAACDADYVAGNMLSGRHEHVKKHERTYVERIATEVIAEFRALIDDKAVRNG